MLIKKDKLSISKKKNLEPKLRKTEYTKFKGNNPFASQAKMLWHLDRLAEWKLNGDTFPVQMEINLTNYCNEACRWCISSYSHIFNPNMTPEQKKKQIEELDKKSVISNHPERKKGIEFEALKKFLVEAKDMGLKAVTWSGGGEPTTYKHFAELVEFTYDLGLEQGLMTNGLFPKKYVPIIGPRLRWLRVSLDTLSAERYEYQKFTKHFQKVIDNIHLLVKEDVKVGVNMNLAAWNSDEILDMAVWCKNAGVEYFQIRPILGLPYKMKDNEPYREQLGQDWLTEVKPQLQAAEQIRREGFTVNVSWDKFSDVMNTEGNFGRTYKSCTYHYFFCVLNADGDLCVCMYHLGNEDFSFGNIYESSVKEIWESEKRQEAIKMCKDDLDLSKCQVCCKGHEINKFMHFLDNPNTSSDVNFL